MNKADQILLKLYFLLLMFLGKIQLWAQNDDDDVFGPSRRGGSGDVIGADEFMDYQPINIRISDIITLVLLLIACYVFGKIWKGCSYLLLAFAALMYYLIRL